jgi:predicted Zn-dependent peptidase
MISSTLQERADERKNKDVIGDALTQYGLYGAENKYTVRMKESKMRSLKPADLIKKIKTLSSYKHDVYYYGPRAIDQVVMVVKSAHKTKKKLSETPAVKRFQAQNVEEPKVLFSDYPGMAQAELTWTMKGDNYNKSIMPEILLYNEYFGGGMAGILFQTIRESKALAYSTYSSFRVPYTKSEPFTMISYVGTQADKVTEAAPAMVELLTNMPESENLFEMSKKSIQNVIESERIIKQNIIYFSDRMDRLGLSDDIRKTYYEKIPAMKFSDLKKFADSNIKGRKMNMMVVGDQNKVNLEFLSKYGKLEKVSLDKIFGEIGAKP